jgi:hypothetical protein
LKEIDEKISIHSNWDGDAAQPGFADHLSPGKFCVKCSGSEPGVFVIYTKTDKEIFGSRMYKKVVDGKAYLDNDHGKQGKNMIEFLAHFSGFSKCCESHTRTTVPDGKSDIENPISMQTMEMLFMNVQVDGKPAAPMVVVTGTKKISIYGDLEVIK